MAVPLATVATAVVLFVVVAELGTLLVGFQVHDALHTHLILLLQWKTYTRYQICKAAWYLREFDSRARALRLL